MHVGLSRKDRCAAGKALPTTAQRVANRTTPSPRLGDHHEIDSGDPRNRQTRNICGGILLLGCGLFGFWHTCHFVLGIKVRLERAGIGELPLEKTYVEIELERIGVAAQRSIAHREN